MSIFTASVFGPNTPQLCGGGGGGGGGGHHHLARGGGGGGDHGGQDGRHHPTSLQSVKLDQEKDEEKAHAKHLKRIKYMFYIQLNSNENQGSDNKLFEEGS